MTNLDTEYDTDRTPNDDVMVLQPAQPMINVGNIVDGEGTVVVSPGDLYRGNPYSNFKITFTAKGPMYSDSDEVKIDIDGDADAARNTGYLEREKAHILIQFPFAKTAVNNLSVSRGTIVTTTTYPAADLIDSTYLAPTADNSIVIKVDGLNEGQSVVVSGNISRVPIEAIAMTKVAGPSGQVDQFTSSFRVFTNTGPLTDSENTPTDLSDDTIVWTAASGATLGSELERSTLQRCSTAIGTVADPTALTTDANIDVTGGTVRAKAGSGTLTVTVNGAETVEKGTKEATLVLVYEAVTAFTAPIVLTLDPNLIGIVKDNVSVTGVNVA